PEIIALGKKIDAPSGGIWFRYNSTGSWTFMALIESFGGDILTQDGKDVAFDSAAGLKALTTLAEIGAARGHRDMTEPQAGQACAAGSTGIMIDTSSQLEQYTKAAAGKFELRAVPFPVADPTKGRIPPSGISAVILTKDPQKQKAAWDYIKTATGPIVQAHM